MLKTVIFTALCLSPFLGHSANVPPKAVIANDSVAREALLKATDQYVRLMGQLGGSEKLADPTMLKSLCAPELKRIFNGKLYAKNSDEFLADLLSFKEGYGQWEIRPIDIIIAPERQAAVLYYDITIKDLGDFTTISILHFNADHLITDINEVFSRSLGFSPYSSVKEVEN